MNVTELMQKVAIEVRDASNDIDAYLASDVPIECYRKDIDTKLVQMKVNLMQIIADAAGVPLEVTNGPQPNLPRCLGKESGGPEWQGGYREPYVTEGFG